MEVLIMNIQQILNDSLNISYENFNDYLNQYDLSPEEKVAAFTFYHENVKQKKAITISAEKNNNYKSIADKVEYVHLFPKNLKKIIKEYNLTSNELLVTMEILDSMMSHGNMLINFSQARLCELTEINKSTMSKVFKSLRTKKVLIENENGNLYINSVVFMKGLPHKLFIQYREHFLKSIEYKLTEEENFDQVFDAEFIKTYESNIKKIKDKKEELEQKKKDKTLKSFNETLKTELKEATEENFDLIFDEQN
jgi:hypothetical protein